MADIEKAAIYNGGITETFKGKQYEIKPLPLKYIVNDDFANCGLIFPRSKEDLGQFQIYNLADKEKRAQFEKWLPLLLFKDGKPVTLDDICADEWDVVDIGKFLDLAVKLSG